MRLGDASFNIVLYPEIGLQAASWLSRQFGQKMTKTVPIGVGATRDFIAEVAELAGVDPSPLLDSDESRLPWYSRSVDSNYLTGKRVFIFGDATHAVAAARIASEELGFTVVGLGTYTREFAREVRDAAEHHGVEALITDDYLEVEARISRTAAGTRSRHADGTAYRQAAGSSLRGDLRAGARAGLSRALLAADGLRRRQRHLRHLGASADDGPGGTSSGHVP